MDHWQTDTQKWFPSVINNQFMYNKYFLNITFVQILNKFYILFQNVINNL